MSKEKNIGENVHLNQPYYKNSLKLIKDIESSASPSESKIENFRERIAKNKEKIETKIRELGRAIDGYKQTLTMTMEIRKKPSSNEEKTAFQTLDKAHAQRVFAQSQLKDILKQLSEKDSNLKKKLSLQKRKGSRNTNGLRVSE